MDTVTKLFDDDEGEQVFPTLKRAPDSDAVFRPKHYARWKIEPITFVMANELPYAEGNIIKYVMRWRDKNGIEDLKKARRYIDMLIENEARKTAGTQIEMAINGQPL